MDRRYTIVYYELKEYFGLTFGEYKVMDLINNLSMKGGSCWMSKEKMARDLCLSKCSVQRAIKRLGNLGLIERKSKNNHLRPTVLWFEQASLYLLRIQHLGKRKNKKDKWNSWQASRNKHPSKSTKIFLELHNFSGLTFSEYSIIDLIDYSSMKTGWCIKTRKEIATDLHFSAKAVRNGIHKLSLQGFLEKHTRKRWIKPQFYWFELSNEYTRRRRLKDLANIKN